MPNILKDLNISGSLSVSGSISARNITSACSVSGIPISGSTGKISNGWINTGSGNGLDADTVDNLHASSFALESEFLNINLFGFLNQTETSIAFDGVNTFSLAPVSSTWSYFRSGLKYTISGSKVVTLSGSSPSPKGQYYIYIDATDGTLTSSLISWTLEDTKVPVATVTWDNSLTPKHWLSEERHTCLVDRRYHWEHHFSDGTEVITFPALTGPNVSPSSPADTDNTMAISTAVLSDEDIKHTLNTLLNPDATTAKYVVMFRTSASSWNWESSIMPYRYSAGGYIQYDSSGSMTQLSNGQFCNSYLLLTNMDDGGAVAARFIFIPGQNVYSSLASAQAESFLNLIKTGLPIAEYIAAYQFTWDAKNAYGTSGKCRLGIAPVRIQISAAGVSATPQPASWGTINGTLSNQTDLQVALDAKISNITSSSPIVVSGSTSPIISILPASGSVAGSLSATDKAKLDTLTGSYVASVGLFTNLHVAVFSGSSGSLIIDSGSALLQAQTATEDLTSQISGSTLHFTTGSLFISNSILVFKNGIAQIKTADFIEDVGLNGFTFSASAVAINGDKVYCIYQKGGNLLGTNANTLGGYSASSFIQTSGSVASGHLVVYSGASGSVVIDGGAVPTSGSGGAGSIPPALKVIMNRSFI